MGLLVYKVADYSFTAEREQYRAICEMLKKHYSSRSEVCLFVANYSIYDSEIDGILFKNDAVISVEFKNYGGEVTAVENGCRERLLDACRRYHREGWFKKESVPTGKGKPC